MIRAIGGDLLDNQFYENDIVQQRSVQQLFRLPPGERNTIIEIIGRQQHFAVTYEGEEYTGPALAALLRQSMIGVYRTTSTRMWSNAANDIAVAYTKHDWEERGFPDWETYAKTVFGGFVTLQTVSAMRTWVTKVVPRLERMEIDPDTLTSRLSPSAMEALVPLLSPEDATGRGRKASIADRTDELVEIICTMVAGAVIDGENGEPDIVLEPVIRSQPDVQSLKNNPAFTSSAIVMDSIVKAGFDPMSVYTTHSLEWLQQLGDFVLTKKLHQMDPNRGASIMQQVIETGDFELIEPRTQNRPFPESEPDEFDDDTSPAARPASPAAGPASPAARPATPVSEDDFEENDPETPAPDTTNTVFDDDEFFDDDNAVTVIDPGDPGNQNVDPDIITLNDPDIVDTMPESIPVVLRALGFKRIQFEVVFLGNGQFTLKTRLPISKEDLTTLVEMGFPVYKDNQLITGKSSPGSAAQRIMEQLAGLVDEEPEEEVLSDDVDEFAEGPPEYDDQAEPEHEDSVDPEDEFFAD